MSNNLAISEKLDLRQLRGKALWASLATLIDGEGYIGLIKDNANGTPRFHPTIVVANTNQEWMKAWRDRTNRGMLYKQTTQWVKPSLRWVITKRADAVYILKRIRPYLFVKAEQASLLIRFFEDKPNKGTHLGELELIRREGIYSRMRELNAKGIRRDYTPDTPPGSDIVRPIEPSVELGANDLVQ